MGVAVTESKTFKSQLHQVCLWAWLSQSQRYSNLSCTKCAYGHGCHRVKDIKISVAPSVLMGMAVTESKIFKSLLHQVCLWTWLSQTVSPRHSNLSCTKCHRVKDIQISVASQCAYEHDYHKK